MVLPTGCPGTVESDLLDEVVLAARILDARHLVEAFGHVSARLRDGTMVITPRNALSLVKREDLAVLDIASGDVIHGRPPLESAMHRAVYASDPAVAAVVRTHSRMVGVLGVLNRPLPVLHGFGAWLGVLVPVHDDVVLVTDYERANRLAAALDGSEALILRGNGAVVPGKSVVEACFKAVILEEAADLYWRARLLGEPLAFTTRQVAERNAQDRVHEPVRAWEHYRGKLARDF